MWLTRHLRNECLFGHVTKDGKPDLARTMHPDYNDENLPFAESNKGKTYISFEKNSIMAESA